MNEPGKRSWRPAKTLAALVALAAVLSAVALRVPAFHGQPRIVPDSITYLEANALRTPAYPLVLAAIQKLPGGLDLLAPFQLLVFAATSVWLSYQFVRTYERPLLGLVLEVMVLGHPQLVSYGFTVLPESLFATVLMIHMSFVLMLARRWNNGAAAAAGVSAAILPLLKPSGYAAVAGLAVLAFVHRGHWRRLHWLVMPAALMILTASAGNLLVRGFFGTQLQGGYSRVAYVATLLEPTTPTPFPLLTERLASALRPIGRELHSLPTIESFYLLAGNEYHGIEETAHREIIAEIGRERGRVVTDTSAAPNDTPIAEATDRLGGILTTAAIRQHAGEYAYQTAANAYGLWWLPSIQTARGAAALQSQVDDLVARRPALARLAPGFRVVPLPAYIAIRLLLAAILACSVVGLFWTMSHDSLRRCVGYLALLLHGYVLLVSLAQPGLPRYALVVWPASALLLLTTAGALSRH